MDLDTSYIEQYIDISLEELNETVKQQEKDRIKINGWIIPFIAISAPIMKTAFIIADHLISILESHKVKYMELEHHKVKYMAIHLYDAFMCKRFWNIYKTVNPLSDCKMIWTEIWKKHFKFSILHLVSCFQLVYKMQHEISLGISQILDVLHMIDNKLEYTQSMILSSEIEVYKTVDYKIPRHTPFHHIEILSAAPGLQKIRGTYYISTNLLDLLYLKFDTLFLQFINMCYAQEDNFKTKQKLASLKSNTLFLSAAVVMCTMYYVCSEKDVLLEKILLTKLAELSNTTRIDIFKMSLVLLDAAINEE